MRTIWIVFAVLLHVRVEVTSRSGERRAFTLADGVNVNSVGARRQFLDIHQNANSIGGGLCINSATATITACTISGNSAGQEGGGVFVGNGSVTLDSTLAAGNTTPGKNPDFDGAFTSLGFNLIQNIQGTLVQPQASDLTGVAPQLGTLRDNGGGLVEEVRSHERKIQAILVDKANMPRPHFIKIYAGAEGSKRWLTAELNAGHAWSEALIRLEPSVLELLGNIQNVQHKIGISIKDLKDINKQMSTGEAKARRTLAAYRRMNCGSEPIGQERRCRQSGDDAGRSFHEVSPTQFIHFVPL